MDLTKPLIKEVHIEVEEEHDFKQSLKYEVIPLYCQQCCEIRHNCQHKKKFVRKWVPKIQKPKSNGVQIIDNSLLKNVV